MRPSDAARRWRRNRNGLWEPSRRGFLRGATGGAATLAALAQRSARAQSLEAPKRVIFVHHSQGTVMEQFLPEGDERSFSLPYITEPLAPWTDRLLFLAGVDNVMTLYNTVGNSHNNAVYTTFTGRPFPIQDGSRVTSAGPSIDQIIAQRIGGDTPFGRLDFVVGGSSTDGFVNEDRFWIDRDDPVVSFNNPELAILRIFGDDTISEADAWALRARRSSVLDAVLDTFRAAEQRVGTAGLARLASHKEKLFALEQRISGGVGECTPARFTAPTAYDFTYDDDISALAMNDIIVTALSCDYARVATLDYSNTHDHAFPWLWAQNGGPIVDTGVWDNWHGMVHADYQEGMELVYRWYIDNLVDLIERLSVTTDADGDNMLDTTLVVYMSEFSSGRHWYTSLPIILIGNLGPVEAGRFVNHMTMDRETYQESGGTDYTGITTNQFYTSLLHMLGFDDETFGYTDDPALPTGGVPGL